ncbi:caffeoylshikimate esterase-like [Abrus precatorius]|uniref:Caffeoylshikimate esterase-like n=1 Tax=Abrus precatorius TaxID=3816 RepID=A0A8B8ML39_ABRPR|nr:caffeoylshikimate esterase-like [Abrus precatorius]
MELKSKYFEVYTKNSKGKLILTSTWSPNCFPKALVFLCHGYGMEYGKSTKACGEKFANAGYAAFGVNHEGHGRSAGVHCLTKKFDDVVNDCEDFFKSVCEFPEYKGMAKFLYGESTGGAVCLLLHKKCPSFWDGAIFVAPVCKISEKLRPHPKVVNILTKVDDIIPILKIFPTKDVTDSALKNHAKRDTIRNNKLKLHEDKPKLKTMEMSRTSVNLKDKLHEVKLPFLVLQGERGVADPKISKALYEQASSTDKTIKLYKGMCYDVTSGETEENITLVFSDIMAWLDKRTSKTSFESS